jgi:hypothetical protein
MGMVMGLVAVRDDTIRALLADPPLLWKLLAPDDPELYDAARTDSVLGSGVDELRLASGEGENLYLDKSWHGLHYLFTGTAWEGPPPLNFLVAGGEPIGDIDSGYGPSRALTAAEVAQADRALAALSDETIRSRFDPAAMMSAEIYPTIWNRPPEEDDTLGYLIQYLGQLRDFLSRVATDGMGIVISIS